MNEEKLDRNGTEWSFSMTHLLYGSTVVRTQYSRLSKAKAGVTSFFGSFADVAHCHCQSVFFEYHAMRSINLDDGFLRTTINSFHQQESIACRERQSVARLPVPFFLACSFPSCPALAESWQPALGCPFSRTRNASTTQIVLAFPPPKMIQ